MADHQKDHPAWEQPRSAYLFNAGLISHEEANAWREEVWQTGSDEEGEQDVA